MAPVGNTAAFDSIVRYEVSYLFCENVSMRHLTISHVIKRQIPNYGLLKSMFVRIKLTTATNGARIANTYGALQLCNYIEIASQNKVSLSFSLSSQLSPLTSPLPYL